MLPSLGPERQPRVFSKHLIVIPEHHAVAICERHSMALIEEDDDELVLVTAHAHELCSARDAGMEMLPLDEELLEFVDVLEFYKTEPSIGFMDMVECFLLPAFCHDVSPLSSPVEWHERFEYILIGQWKRNMYDSVMDITITIKMVTDIVRIVLLCFCIRHFAGSLNRWLENIIEIAVIPLALAMGI